jgi:thiol-disulfide isomerase/thioredoxin
MLPSMSRLLCASVVLLLAAPALAEDEMWKWADDDGTPHYTNDKSTIPAKHRARATRTNGTEIGVVNTQEGASLPDAVGNAVDKATGKDKPIELDGDEEPARPEKNGPPARYTNDVKQVIVFGAPWCQPCLMLKKQRTLEQLIEAHPELKLRDVDADQKPDFAKKYGVTVLPTIVFTDMGGKEFLRVRGPKTLEQFERALTAARGQKL